jgi:hypothetical protein
MRARRKISRPGPRVPHRVPQAGAGFYSSPSQVYSHMALKLPKARRLEVEREAWDRSQRGWSHRRIAAELGVDQRTVGRAIARVYARGASRIDEDARLQVVLILAQLRHALDETFQAWERSKRPSRRSSRTSGPPLPDGSPSIVTTEEIEERDGNVEFLLLALKLLGAISDLLNLEAVTRPIAVAAARGPWPDRRGLPPVRDVMADALAADAAYVPDPA